MKKLKLSLFMLFCASTIVHAQTWVIDYQAWSTSQCNAFSNSPTIGGLVHKSITGQPQNGGGNPVSLECNYSGSSPMGTEYGIVKPFLSNHQYLVTVEVGAITNNMFPNLKLSLIADPGGSGSLCTGTSSINPLWGSNISSQSVPSSSYISLTFNMNIGAQGYSAMAVSAIPDPSSANTSTHQWIVIRKITIVDNTPNPGTFSITASQNSRACLTTGNITFTANHTTNPNNVTVSTYRFYPEPGQWLYNGSDAPTFIDKPASTPTITLTPIACATNLKVSGQAITNIPLTVNITPKIISSTVPPFLPPITGPDTIKSYAAATASADYSISLGAISACTLPTWSIVENPTPYIQSVVANPNNPFSATVTKSPYIYGPIVNLKVNLNMCGVNTSVTKPITLDWKQSIFGFMSGNFMLNDDAFSVSPNPVSSNAHINFGKKIEEGHIDIISVDGKHVKSLEIKGSSFLDISMDNINPGIYLVWVVDGKTQQKIKIIKK
jgi:hypothetical protein